MDHSCEFWRSCLPITSCLSQSAVDKILKKTNLALVIGTSSWREQFLEAITVSSGMRPCPHPPTHLPTYPGRPLKLTFISALPTHPGDDDTDDGDGDGDGPEKTPSCQDYAIHFITVLWKVLFALVPPTDYWSGWACFTVSMCGIGLLTAVIGDLASHFGCTIGLKDSVTAVVFVALGTSVPGERWLCPLTHTHTHTAISVNTITKKNHPSIKFTRS